MVGGPQQLTVVVRRRVPMNTAMLLWDEKARIRGHPEPARTTDGPAGLEMGRRRQKPVPRQRQCL